MRNRRGSPISIVGYDAVLKERLGKTRGAVVWQIGRGRRVGLGSSGRRRCFDVALVADDVVITRYWRTSRRIPVDRIIAVTNYPSVIWYSRDGKVVRSSAGSLATLPTKFPTGGLGDPRGPERRAFQDLLHDRVASHLRKVKRGIAHFSPEDAADRLCMARAAVAWTARRRSFQARDFHDLWVEHLRAIEPATAER
jgi:hypothetical protein